MNASELQPEGFQPELLGYFTPFDIQRFAARIQPASRRYRSIGEVYEVLAKDEEDLKRLWNLHTASQRMVDLGLPGSQVEGIHVWSTVYPKAVTADVVLRKNKVKAPINTSERKGLLAFFRENTQDLPEVAAAWFNLPHPLGYLKEIESDEERKSAAKALLDRMARGETSLNPDNPFRYVNLRGAVKVEVDSARKHVEGLERHSPLEAIRFVNRRLNEVESKYTGIDATIVQDYHYLLRAHIQGYLVEKGGFINLPHGNKLRSLCILSDGIDLMRADLVYGAVTNRGSTIAECFGFSEMEDLQRRAVDKTANTHVEVFYHDSLPHDPEIAYMKKQIMARIQNLL